MTALVAFLLALALSCVERVNEPEPVAPVPVVVQEDSPEWDCEVMGNRVCGPMAGHEPIAGETERESEARPARTACPDGMALAEDLSCVPSNYWSEPSEGESE